jgi:hypothetical protein
MRSLGIHQRFRPNALNHKSLKEEVTLNPNSRSWQQQDQRSPGPGLSSKARPWKQCKCHMPQQRISSQNGKDPASSGPNTIAIRCFFVTDRPMKRSHHRVKPHSSRCTEFFHLQACTEHPVHQNKEPNYGCFQSQTGCFQSRRGCF